MTLFVPLKYRVSAKFCNGCIVLLFEMDVYIMDIIILKQPYQTLFLADTKTSETEEIIIKKNLN